MAIKFELNGKPVSTEAQPDTPLLWVIRDDLKLTGTKFGCGMAQCGACTVHFNGQPQRSCVLPVSAVQNATLTTIEGAKGKQIEALQQAWNELDVPQCGYCQSGQLMSAAALLSKKPKPSDDDIDSAMNGNVCRCSAYMRIRQAIHLAAEKLEA